VGAVGGGDAGGDAGGDGPETHSGKIKKHFDFGTGFLTRLARDGNGLGLDSGPGRNTPVFGTSDQSRYNRASLQSASPRAVNVGARAK